MAGHGAPLINCSASIWALFGHNVFNQWFPAIVSNKFAFSLYILMGRQKEIWILHEQLYIISWGGLTF